MSSFKCPSCNRKLKVIPLSASSSSPACQAMPTGRQADRWSPGQTYNLGADVPEGTTYSKETPFTDMSGIEAGLKPPLAQSGITALAAGAVTLVGMFWQSWHWTTPLVVVVAVFGLSWYLLLTSNRRLLRTVETIDRPVEVEQVAATFNVEITETLEGQRQRMRFAQFPVKERDVKRFALAALNQRLTIHGGHGLGRGAFEKMRDESIARGLLRWTNEEAHNQGCELTRVGSAVFKRLSD